MIFNSLIFCAFFCISLLFFVTAKGKARPYILLLSSAVFYAASGYYDSSVIIILLSLNWLILYSPCQYRIPLSILVNIGCLAGIKYWDFFSGSEIIRSSYTDVSLPLGISFYTFQMLAYQIDVVKGKVKEVKSLSHFTLFITFFPQLIAGPIVRAYQLLPQLNRLFAGSLVPKRLISYGLALILLGLVKKIVFADSLAPIVDNHFLSIPTNTYDAWLGAYLFTFQIYFDFSGYSDIAIGIAYLYNLRLPVNFQTPYLSTSPQEFWQRWHITLSSWIRDYLYIPLGGSKGTWIINLITLLLVMGLAGLWHGANWTFIIWGIAWGAYIALGRLLRQSSIKLPKHILWLPHFTLIIILWVLFRAPNFDQALSHIATMFMLRGTLLPSLSPEHIGFILPILGCIILILLHYGESFIHSPRMIYILRSWNTPLVWGLLSGLSILLIMIPKTDSNPFIYFRF